MQWHRPFQAVSVTVSFTVLTPRWTACERLHFAVFSGPREVTRVRPDSQSIADRVPCAVGEARNTDYRTVCIGYRATHHGRYGLPVERPWWRLK